MRTARFVVPAVVFLGAAAAQENPGIPRWNPQILDIGSKNSVPNSSFEAGSGGWSSIGQLTAWGGELTGLVGEITNDAAFDGARSLKIELGPGKTPVTHFDGWPAQRVVQAAPLAGNVGWLPATVGEPYTFSVYMKADRDGVPAQLAFYIPPDPRISAYSLTKRSTQVTLTTDWERYSYTLPAETLQFYVAVGPDLSATPDAAATVWIDAVQVERGTEATGYVPRETLEIGLDTPHFANVFPSGEAPSVTITATNVGADDEVVTVRASITDYYGKVLPEQSTVVSAPSGVSSSSTLNLGIDRPGFYRVTLGWSSGERPHEQFLRVVSLPPFRIDDSVMGVNHAPPNDALCQMLVKGGVLWVRECSFDWNQIEPVEGQIDFSMQDSQVDRLLKNGFKVMALLPSFGTANWASEAPADLDKYIPETPPYPPQWPRMGYAPKDPQTLYRFIGAAVTHFKDRVHTWEFWNEPFTMTSLVDTKAHNLPGRQYTTRDYVNFLTGAAKAMREADPHAVVLGGMQGPPMEHSASFIEDGGLKPIDVYTIHPYGLKKQPETFIEPMRTLQAAMDASAEGRRPIWLTECGYYGEDDKPWEPYYAPEGHWSANKLQRDEREAADYTVRHALIMLAYGAQKIFIHQPIEGELNNGNNFIESPFWTQGGAAEKAYSACAALAGVMGASPKFVAELAKPETVGGQSTDSLYGYSFQCGERAVMAVWAVPSEGETDTPWRITVPDATATYDAVGAKVGGGPVPLGASPVYFEANGGDAKDLASSATLDFGA